MTQEYKPYKPTDAEQTTIARAGIEAAFAELAKMSSDGSDSIMDTLVVLRAYKAAHEALRRSAKQVFAMHPDYSTIYDYATTGATVNSAFVCHLSGVAPADAVAPSVEGDKLAALLRAAKVLCSMSDVLGVMDDEDGVFGEWLATEAEALLKVARNP